MASYGCFSHCSHLPQLAILITNETEFLNSILQHSLDLLLGKVLEQHRDVESGGKAVVVGEQRLDVVLVACEDEAGGEALGLRDFHEVVQHGVGRLGASSVQQVCFLIRNIAMRML